MIFVYYIVIYADTWVIYIFRLFHNQILFHLVLFSIHKLRRLFNCINSFIHSFMARLHIKVLALSFLSEDNLFPSPLSHWYPEGCLSLVLSQLPTKAKIKISRSSWLESETKIWKHASIVRCILAHLIHTTMLLIYYYYYSYFTNVENEAKRD